MASKQQLGRGRKIDYHREAIRKSKYRHEEVKEKLITAVRQRKIDITVRRDKL
jgi:hypothetical protein